jgi:adenylate kinase
VHLAKEQPLIVIFLGAPGAGKGTQAASVAREMDMAHISSGDLFRQAVERGDVLGRKVKAYMEKGALVPDEITIQMVLDRLAQPSKQRGVILDGFPRNLAQAENLDGALKNWGKAVSSVVYIRVSQSELVRRLSSRWLCRQCQAPYTWDGAGDAGTCKECGGELYQRADDFPETVKKRLEVYFRDTAPLVDYYRQRSKLVEIDGEGDVKKVTGRIVSAVGGRI